jgi:hypothetical protein
MIRTTTFSSGSKVISEVKLPDNHRFVRVRDGARLVFIHAFKKPGNAIPDKELRTCRAREASYREKSMS